MKVFVLHELEDDAGCNDPECCGGPSYSSKVYGVFSTEKHAKDFQKEMGKFYRDAEITETELNPQPLKTKKREGVN